MSHQENYYLETSLVDKNLNLKLSSLFLLFQDIAGKHAEELGIGKASTTDVGLKWIITRYRIDFNKLPKYGETIKLVTYPGKRNPFFFFRHFYMEDLEGNLLLKASSVWVVLDAKTNKVKTNPFSVEVPEEFLEDELPNPDKILEDATTLVSTREVTYSDIDLNGHLNNTRYIEFIQDIHDSEFYKNHEIKTLTINYSQEIKEGNTVNIYSNNQNPEIIKGKVNDVESFKIKIEYKE